MTLVSYHRAIMHNAPYDPTVMPSIGLRSTYRERRDSTFRRGTIMVRSPKVDPAEAKKWHGAPPTALATEAQWRPKDITF